MTPENFCYWLQGIVETHEGETLTPRQFEIIRDHLALVFQKQTPDRPLVRSGGSTTVQPPHLILDTVSTCSLGDELVAC